MKPRLSHPAAPTPAEARALQERLRGEVVREDRLGPVRRVAGVDVAYDRASAVLFAAVVVLDADSLEPVETRSVKGRSTFPYVPGLLSFRELPSVIRAFGALRTRPDLVVCDGHGYAHPRRFGLACHLGVLFDVPSIGCAKTPFVGSHPEPALPRGSHRPITLDGEVVGEVVRTRDGVQPVYVLVGHRVCLPTARRWILRLTPRYRQPETTRAAHGEVTRLRAGGGV